MSSSFNEKIDFYYGVLFVRFSFGFPCSFYALGNATRVCAFH